MVHSDEQMNYFRRRNIDVGSTKWKIKFVFGHIIYAVLLVFYIPFFLLGVFQLYRLIATMKIKRALGLKTGNMRGKLGVASRRHKIVDMSAVDTEDELDFLENRSFGYIWRMCFWTPWELTLFFLKEQKIKLISDGQLAYVVLCTVFGHSVTWDDSRKMFRLSMKGIEDLQLFEGFYWEAREILVSEDGKKIIICMEGGEEFHSDCEPHLRPTFDLAKLHAQVCLSFMGPGLLHNNVHFLLPSCVAVLATDLLDHDKVLYKLLSPHFRFTERINYQALKVQKATNNKRSQFDRFFFHWQPFPVIKEIFREGVAKKCKEHYLEEGAQDCDVTSHMIYSDGEGKEERNGAEKPESVKRKQTIKRKHTLFPPAFVTDENLRKVPYLNFLAEYYAVIRSYVQDLEPHIDKEEWKILSQELAKYVPRFDKAEMVDAIASYILKVGLVHFCDHETYVRYFSYKYACMSMRTPFEPFEEDEMWDEICEESKVDVELAKRDASSLIFQRDVLRTRAFLNIFVDFIPNPKCNLFLADTQYNFEEAGPQMAETKFKKRLRELDEKLLNKNVMATVPEAEKDEDRGEGMQLIPVRDIIRTVCY